MILAPDAKTQNTPANPTSPGKPSRKPREIHRDYREFLPAAMALVETPPSPTRMAMSWTICALIAVSLAWGWFGRLDVISQAQGKIQPSGRVKVIQPVDAGKISEIVAVNGKHVLAGDVLVELDAREAKADLNEAMTSLTASEAEVARRRAAIEGARNAGFAPPAIVWPNDVPEGTRVRETQVLKGDLAQLAAAVSSFDAQARQKKNEIDRVTATIAAQEHLISVQNERVSMKQTLVDKAAGTKKDLIDASETVAFAQTQLETQRGQLAIANGALDVIEQDRAKLVEGFVSDNGQKLSDASRQVDEYRQRVAKANAHLEHATIRSPVNGTVTGSSLLSRGQVVSSGDEIMRVVPDDTSLEIEAYLPNSEIGFVKTGQLAEVKIDAFPFTRFGTIKADVETIAEDAIPEPDASRTEGAPNAASKSSFLAGTQRVQNLVFPIVLKPRVGKIDVEGSTVALSAGMTVTVEIKTGSRRILEYVFAPLADIGSNALKER